MFVRRRVIPCANSDMEWLYSFNVRHTQARGCAKWFTQPPSFIIYQSVVRNYSSSSVESHSVLFHPSFPFERASVPSAFVPLRASITSSSANKVTTVDAGGIYIFFISVCISFTWITLQWISYHFGCRDHPSQLSLRDDHWDRTQEQQLQHRLWQRGCPW